MGGRPTDIWQELRRRHVVRTAAGYAAVSFVLLQLGEILFPSFGLDDAALRSLLAVLLAGLPVILAISWFYDVRAGGLHKTAPAGEEDAVPVDAPAPSVVLVGGVLLVAAAVGFGVMYGVLRFEPPAPIRSDPAIAVLPFADMSVAGDQAYLGDGLAEEVLNILAGLDGLKVAARTSSFAFRNSPDDVRDIGRQLGVNTLLEGSVRRDGQQVRVTAQLIDTESGFHLWSANFDRTVDDLFAVQDEIAAAIVQELLGTLELSTEVASRHEPPQAAVDAYWKGRAAWRDRGATGIPSAIALFNEAVSIDSLYAQAHAGLADSWALLPQVAPATDAADALARAEGYALDAIALDATLAEAHASLGLVRALQGNRVGALESLGRAVDLNPSYAPAYHWRANVLAEMGQLDAARSDAGRAASLDPLSAAIATDLGYILLWAGRVDEAEAQFDRAIDTEFRNARAQLGTALVGLERADPFAVQMALTQWTAVSDLPTSMAPTLAAGMLAYQGTSQGTAVPPALDGLVAERALTAGTAASLAALVGDRSRALEWLRQSVDDRSWVDQFLAVNTAYDPIRDDPEFQAVLQEISGP